MGKHLIIGAAGQLGIELMLKLQERFGADNVVLTDIRPTPHPDGAKSLFVEADARDRGALRALCLNHDFEVVYNLVAMLSAKGEVDPMAAWKLNMDPLLSVLELAREGLVNKVFWPSSIAVFGPDAPKMMTPQDAPLHPTTIYGVSKVAGELWCAYYHQKYGVDVRSLRYPGLIGYRSQPGGGTTDYAVDALIQAAQSRGMQCYLDANERLPMMSMNDAIRGTLELMDAPSESIKVRTSYNLHGCDFSPAELEAAIQIHEPAFAMTFAPDHRQDIAASWPDSLDDSAAQRDWGWKSQLDVEGLVKHIFQGFQQPA